VAIIGAGNIGCKVALKLVERGADVYMTRRDDRGELLAEALNVMKARHSLGMIYSERDASKSAQGAHALIGFTQGYAAIDGAHIAALAEGALVVDGGVGTVTVEAIRIARLSRRPIYRLDIRIALPYVIDSILSTAYFLQHVAGTTVRDGKTYVAGGYIGGAGDIVVDHIAAPQTVIGIADGRGGVIRDGRNVGNDEDGE